MRVIVRALIRRLGVVVAVQLAGSHNIQFPTAATAGEKAYYQNRAHYA